MQSEEVQRTEEVQRCCRCICTIKYHGGAEVQCRRCRCAEMQRCRGAGAEVQAQRCAGVLADEVQRGSSRSAEVHSQEIAGAGGAEVMQVQRQRRDIIKVLRCRKVQ